MATIKLDVVYDKYSLIGTLLELTKDLNITFDETGSREAGGWPEIEFSGPVEDLEVLAHRYNGDNGLESFGELLKLIKK